MYIYWLLLRFAFTKAIKQLAKQKQTIEINTKLQMIVIVPNET